MYWAALGLQRAGGKEYSVDELNTDRIVFQGIQNLYRRGKIIVYSSRVPAPNDPCSIIERESIFLFPDLRMFDRYDQALTALEKKYTEVEGNVESLQNAHRNALKRAVLLFYQAGHIDRAAEIYNTLRKNYPQDKDIQVSLIEYVRTRFTNELADAGINDIREIITLMLVEANYRYAVGDDDEAFGRENMAREVYDFYQIKFEHKEETDRVKLPPFDVIRYIGIISFLSDQRYPDFVRKNLVDRIRVERPEIYEKMEQQHEYFLQEMQKQESTQQ
jgi:tetratricopeptide (TPR) repeat protein